VAAFADIAELVFCLLNLVRNSENAQVLYLK